VLYACDGAWWRARRGMKEFSGLKLTADIAVAKQYPALHHVSIASGKNRILSDVPGVIGDGGNSGFQALNLAVQFGARRIGLVGFDMRADGGLHWHGRHDRGLNNPTGDLFVRWRRVLDGVAPRLASLGVEVLNLSRVSALTAYPFAMLDQVLTC
jgi:hypothetical protein